MLFIYLFDVQILGLWHFNHHFGAFVTYDCFTEFKFLFSTHGISP